MKKGLGRLIARRTDALDNAMQELPIREKTRWEIAFQIAELSPEFEAILEIIKKAGKGQKITRRDLSDLHGMVQCHWPMHLRPLVRYLRRAFDELELEQAEASDMEGMIKQIDAHIGKVESVAKRRKPSSRASSPKRQRK